MPTTSRMATTAPPPMAAIRGPPLDALGSSPASVSPPLGIGVGVVVGVALSSPPAGGVAVPAPPPVGVVAGDLVMLGSDSTVMLSAAEAAAAVPRLEESEVRTMAAVEAGTVMVAVMRTLAAATVTLTAEASTPAAVAIESRRAEESA